MSAPRFMYAGTHKQTRKHTNKQTNKQTTNKQTKKLTDKLQTNKKTNKQTNHYMSVPRGMSEPRLMYAHTHSQTNKLLPVSPDCYRSRPTATSLA